VLKKNKFSQKQKKKETVKKDTDYPGKSPFAEGRQDQQKSLTGMGLIPVEAPRMEAVGDTDPKTKETREKNDLGSLQICSDTEAVVTCKAILIYLLREVVSKEDEHSDEDVVINSTTDISGDEESDFKPERRWPDSESESNSDSDSEADPIPDIIAKLGSDEENEENEE
jgi:hypothetical protein